MNWPLGSCLSHLILGCQNLVLLCRTMIWLSSLFLSSSHCFHPSEGLSFSHWGPHCISTDVNTHTHTHTHTWKKLVILAVQHCNLHLLITQGLSELKGPSPKREGAGPLLTTTSPSLYSSPPAREKRLSQCNGEQGDDEREVEIYCKGVLDIARCYFFIG